MRLGLGLGIGGSRKKRLGGGFSLTNISNLEVWLKYDTGLDVSAGAVTQWDDQSGNNNHAVQSTSTKQPLYNGGAIHFDGVNDTMLLTNNIRTTDFAIFAVLELDNTTNESLLGNNVDNSEFLRRDGVVWRIRTEGSANQAATAASISSGTKHLFVWWGVETEGTSDYYLREDGSATGTAVWGTYETNFMEIGSMNRGGLPFDGKISELAIYSGTKTLSEIQQVEADIMNRHGL